LLWVNIRWNIVNFVYNVTCSTKALHCFSYILWMCIITWQIKINERWSSWTAMKGFEISFQLTHGTKVGYRWIIFIFTSFFTLIHFDLWWINKFLILIVFFLFILFGFKQSTKCFFTWNSFSCISSSFKRLFLLFFFLLIFLSFTLFYLFFCLCLSFVTFLC